MATKLRKLVWCSGAVLLAIILFLAFEKFIVKITGHTIAVVADSVFEKQACRFKNIKEVKLFIDDQQVIHELESGNVDLAVVDRLVGLNIIKNAGYDNLRLAGDLLNRDLIGAVFRATDKSLRQTINRALKEIIDKGVYAEISIKYFGRDIFDGIEYITYPNEPPATDNSWARIKAAGRITFAISSGPPFSYYNEQYQLAGFDVEIARAVCDCLGIKFVPITIERDEILEGLGANYYDGIWDSRMVIGSQKPKDVQISNPYCITGAQLFARGDIRINGPEDL